MYDRIILTGDTHGEFGSLLMNAKRIQISNKDLLIILGDVGLNIDNGSHDIKAKGMLSSLPCDILCIHGNHEMRPDSPNNGWKFNKINWFLGKVFVEDEYKNIYYAIDGETYDINNRQFFVIGGAYSVDKQYRLDNGLFWFADEQLTLGERAYIREINKYHNYKEDIILCHTCPYNYIPLDRMSPYINQRKVDNSMELFIQGIIDRSTYNALYCGHWHINRVVDKIHFLYDGMEMV